MSISAKNCINSFFHCKNCMKDKPPGTSPAEWARLEVGFTPQGIQVWCGRCDMNIMHVDFEGAIHPANLRADKDDQPEPSKLN